MKFYDLEFNGAMLGRGFWIYAWRITPLGEKPLYYVGRTGDESSPNAASPLKRMGIHLDPRARGNCLWRLLTDRKHKPDDCAFELAAFGPIFDEKIGMEAHRPIRDRSAGLEGALMSWFRERELPILNSAGVRRALQDDDKPTFDKVVSAICTRFAIPASGKI